MSVANRHVSLHAVVAQFVASIVHGFGVIKSWLDWGKIWKNKMPPTMSNENVRVQWFSTI